MSILKISAVFPVITADVKAFEDQKNLWGMDEIERDSIILMNFTELFFNKIVWFFWLI